jgi:outer membrane lipoprotein-sorting protein/peroxiredoxin
MRILALASPILFFFASNATAQDNSLLLLRKVAASYVALSRTSYSFELVETREFPGGTQIRTEQRQRIVGSGGKYRQETLPSGIVNVFDGQYRWSYNPNRNEYTKTPADASANRPPGLGMFQSAASRVKSARSLRQESLELAPGLAMCHVIEVDPLPAGNGIEYSPMTYWIDAGRNLVLKLQYSVTVPIAGRQSRSESAVTLSVTKASVGDTVDESLLGFAPPAGAVQVAHLSFGPKSPLVGEQSPDFELQGADGKPISSASLRGHAVLLQFSPQAIDDSLFLLEMTYRSLKSKGLAVFYVLPQRKQSATDGIAYTVPVGIDTDGSAAKALGIRSTGTVLIDRLGNIAFVDTSSRNSLELARALRTVGVW